MLINKVVLESKGLMIDDGIQGRIAANRAEDIALLLLASYLSDYFCRGDMPDF